MIRSLLLTFLISAVSGLHLFAEGDLCQVSMTDLEAVKKYLEKRGPRHSAPAPEVLGSFTATVAEDRITTQHFLLPLTGEQITASVAYTDKSIELVKPGTNKVFDVSIELALFISPKPVDSAFGQEGEVSSQSDHSKETLWLRVTKIIKHRGKRYAIDLGCYCNGARRKE